MATKEQLIEHAVRSIMDDMQSYEYLLANVSTFFLKNRILTKESSPIIHSVKGRLKDRDSIEKKIRRKWLDWKPRSSNSIVDKMTDVAGVRVLHLFSGQFDIIHREIIKNVNSKEWVLHEDPVVYLWDPDSVSLYQGMGFVTNLKSSYYTSVHYVIKSNKDSTRCCEIQVRTLFEEIWGELDHIVNYPIKTNNVDCARKIKVLSHIVVAGNKLVESIRNDGLKNL